MQIILSPTLEKQCSELDTRLRGIKRLTEMYEVWCELHTTEDEESAALLQQSLESIIKTIIKRNMDLTYDIRSEILVDEEIQTLLRNLNAMPTLMLLLETLFAGNEMRLKCYASIKTFLLLFLGGREELKPRISKIIKTSIQLIVYFLMNCKVNQCLAFKYIEWFIDRIDDGFGSSRVLRVMLDGNAGLTIASDLNYPGIRL